MGAQKKTANDEVSVDWLITWTKILALPPCSLDIDKIHTALDTQFGMGMPIEGVEFLTVEEQCKDKTPHWHSYIKTVNLEKAGKLREQIVIMLKALGISEPREGSANRRIGGHYLALRSEEKVKGTKNQYIQSLEGASSKQYCCKDFLKPHFKFRSNIYRESDISDFHARYNRVRNQKKGKMLNTEEGVVALNNWMEAMGFFIVNDKLYPSPAEFKQAFAQCKPDYPDLFTFVLCNIKNFNTDFPKFCIEHSQFLPTKNPAADIVRFLDKDYNLTTGEFAPIDPSLLPRFRGEMNAPPFFPMPDGLGEWFKLQWGDCPEYYYKFEEFMKSVYQHKVEHKKAVTLISGPPGCGKTPLIQAVRQPLEKVTAIIGAGQLSAGPFGFSSVDESTELIHLPELQPREVKRNVGQMLPLMEGNAFLTIPVKYKDDRMFRLNAGTIIDSNHDAERLFGSIGHIAEAFKSRVTELPVTESIVDLDIAPKMVDPNREEGIQYACHITSKSAPEDKTVLDF